MGSGPRSRAGKILRRKKTRRKRRRRKSKQTPSGLRAPGSCQAEISLLRSGGFPLRKNRRPYRPPLHRHRPRSRSTQPPHLHWRAESLAQGSGPRPRHLSRQPRSKNFLHHPSHHRPAHFRPFHQPAKAPPLQLPAFPRKAVARQIRFHRHPHPLQPTPKTTRLPPPRKKRPPRLASPFSNDPLCNESPL